MKDQHTVERKAEGPYTVVSDPDTEWYKVAGPTWNPPSYASHRIACEYRDAFNAAHQAGVDSERERTRGLVEYAQHKDDCEVNGKWVEHETAKGVIVLGDGPCTCGLDQALSSMKNEQVNEL